MKKSGPIAVGICVGLLLAGCVAGPAARTGTDPGTQASGRDAETDSAPWQPLPGLTVSPRNGTRDVLDTLTITLTSSRPFTVTPLLCDVARERGTWRPSRRIVVSATPTGTSVKVYAPRAGVFELWIEVDGLDRDLNLFYTIRAARGAPDAAYVMEALRPFVAADDLSGLRFVVERWPWDPGDTRTDVTQQGQRGFWDLVWRAADPSGRTVFHMAASQGAEGIARFCIDSGIDVDAVDASGMTALMIASAAGHVKVVRLLRERDADPGARSAEGLQALDYARKSGSAAVLALLQDESYARRVPDPSAWAGEWRGHAYDFFGSSLLSASISVVDGSPRGTLAVTTWDNLSYNGKDVPPETLRYRLRIFSRNGFVHLEGARIPDATVRTGESTHMRARLVSPVLMAGDWSEQTGASVFYMEKTGARTSAPAPLARGKVLALSSLVFPGYHYTCYVPSSADPRRPAPLLIFDNAGGRAAPLEPTLAEELGWVSIGLTESTNANVIDGKPWLNEVCWLAALVDIRHRIPIDDSRIYYAGFSGGAFRSHTRAICFEDMPAAGVLDIGMGLLYAPSHGIPTFYIMGTRDTPGKGFLSGFADVKKQYGALVALRVHPGGHEWRVRPALAEALRWLARK